MSVDNKQNNQITSIRNKMSLEYEIFEALEKKV